MSKPNVHCRCGHQIRAKEILRTDLYERGSGQTYIYVKFRCNWCKRLGEEFVPEPEWDWSSFEPARDEMTEAERQESAQRTAISSSEVLEFHRQLQKLDDRGITQALGGFTGSEADSSPPEPPGGKTNGPRAAEDTAHGKKTKVARRPRRRLRRGRGSQDDTPQTP